MDSSRGSGAGGGSAWVVCCLLQVVQYDLSSGAVRVQGQLAPRCIKRRGSPLLRERQFLEFPNVCPEPVLVKPIVFSILTPKWRKNGNSLPVETPSKR
jgi:hypothetical protein